MKYLILSLFNVLSKTGHRFVIIIYSCNNRHNIIILLSVDGITLNTEWRHFIFIFVRMGDCLWTWKRWHFLFVYNLLLKRIYYTIIIGIIYYKTFVFFNFLLNYTCLSNSAALMFRQKYFLNIILSWRDAPEHFSNPRRFIYLHLNHLWSV